MTNEDYEKIFHEIKNYITFINSSLQLVEKMHPEIKDYSYWNDAMTDVSALKRMVIELSSARLCSNLNLQKVSMENFLMELKDSYTSLLGSSNFNCEFELQSALPEILIDSDRLKRAIFNLVKNSYEAMNGSGQLRLLAYTESNFLRLDLIDSGGGISPEYLPKLFTPFATTKSNGTGLGLLISKQIIEAHNGHLTIDSRPQDGCTFSIFLPCT